MFKIRKDPSLFVASLFLSCVDFLLFLPSFKSQGLLGLPYVANEPGLVRARLRVRRLMHAFNSSLPNDMDPVDLAPGEKAQGIGGSADEGDATPLDVMGETRRSLFAQILGVSRKDVERVEVEPPFWCDYGTNIKLEGSFYCNFNTTILDCAEVRIGTGGSRANRTKLEML